MSSSKPDELFYCEKNTINLVMKSASLIGQEAIHCSKVLRHKEGDEIHFTDADSNLYIGIISRIKKGEVDIQIIDSKLVKDENEKNYPVICIGVLKNKERMEWLIEKATEIGVSAIYFIQLNRSERSKINLDRFKTIALSAMKQSQRLQIPKILHLESLDKGIDLFKSSSLKHFVAHEKIDSNESFQQLLKKNLNGKRPVYWIGPEGGFTEDEVHIIKEKLFAIPISLGKHRLRAETAALFVLANTAM